MPNTETAPKWEDLTDDDKARVIYFGRTAEGEGYAYAHENYSVEGSCTHEGLNDQVAADLYDEHEAMLPEGEWWRLYEKGVSLT